MNSWSGRHPRMAWIWTYRSGATPCVAASLSEALPLPPRVVVFTLGGAPRLRAGRARHPVALTPAILGLASSEQQHVALFQQRCRGEEHIGRVECPQPPLTRPPVAQPFQGRLQVRL